MTLAPQSARMAARVTGFGTSIFSEMSRLAREHHAVNLSQGFPDFDPPAWVRDAAKAAIDAGANQYAVSHGQPRLRQAIADHTARYYGLSYDVDREITVTSGCTEAIFDTILALVNPGDEVVAFEPAYDSYGPAVVMAGGTPRFVPLRAPAWDFDPAELAAAITPRTRLLVLNTPHNPTGKVFTRAELEQIAQLAQAHDLIVVTDEVYEHLVFPPARHVPIATLPGMRERTIILSSAGKTFSLTGWKIGWALAPPDLSEAIRRVHQFVTFASATPFQEAVATAIETAEHTGYFSVFLADYTARRDFLYQALEAAGLHPLQPEGSFFILADIAHLGFPDDITFARTLTTEAGVACIPPSVFSSVPRPEQLARFCFAKRPETLQAAADRLAAWARKRSNIE
jgi:aspartate/methionine/tyrosine aminotransferase